MRITTPFAAALLVFGCSASSDEELKQVREELVTVRPELQTTRDTVNETHAPTITEDHVTGPLQKQTAAVTCIALSHDEICVGWGLAS